MPLKPSEKIRLLKAANRPAQRQPAIKYNTVFQRDTPIMDDEDNHFSDRVKFEASNLELLCELRNLINWSSQFLGKKCHPAYLATALESARETAGKYKPVPKKR